MKLYLSFFKIRFKAGLQYRAAALSGMITQFAWGFMLIVMLGVFNGSTMAPADLSTYVWLNQALLALTAIWALDSSVFETIENGDVAYEAVKPVNLYTLWFVRNVAHRLSRCALRFAPILLIAVWLPEPFTLRLPSTPTHFLGFLLSLALTVTIEVAITMWMYVFVMHTKSSLGIRTFFVALFEMFSGSSIPYAFFPIAFQNILKLTFFYGLQTATFNLYLGLADPLSTLSIQFFWACVLIGTGYVAMQYKLKSFEIVGG